MRFLHHPVHMMLIHFPTAFIPMDLVCFGLQYFTGQPSFAYAAFYAQVGAVVLGWLAVLFGLLDLAGIPPDNTAAIRKGLYHGGLNATVLLVYTGLAYRAYQAYPALFEATPTLLALKGALTIFLMAGNYLGGSLILKHRIGLEP